MNIKTILILSLLLLFSGCSYKQTNKKITYTNISDFNLPFPSASLENTLEKRAHLQKKLYDFYYEWKGVKYKYGGNSKRGIDCSALIQKAYKHKLNIKLPRTTFYQSKLGKYVNINQLKTGDLVFFKTGKNSRHAGIYMKNGTFMHASTSKGVIISKLNNSYFKRHYWKSQRLLP